MFRPFTISSSSEKKSRRPQRPDSQAAVRIEPLETRQLMSAVVVNTTIDGAHGAGLTSLRDAIAVANLSQTPTTITFNPSVFATARTITLNGSRLELRNTGHSTTLVGPAAGLTISGNNRSLVVAVDKGVTAQISGVTITKGSGGGISNYGILSLTKVTVTGNTNTAAGGNGGGIFNHGSATLTNCTVSNNKLSNFAAVGAGAGIYNDLGGTLKLVNVTISGNSNTTDGDGGGIYNFGTATLINTTLANNSCPGGYGGGLADPGSAKLTNCTIDGNFAGIAGGGIEIDIYAGLTMGPASVTLGNSIAAANFGGDGLDDVDGTVKSLGHNFIGESSASSGWTSQDRTGTYDNPLDPKLSLLGNYGGPTQTMVPLPGSPLIDAGSNTLIPAGITTDARGVTRMTNGKVDIGTVETIVLKIHGSVFNDVNGDGIRQASDPGISKWQVYVDLKNTGVFADGDPVATTDASGNYTLTYSPLSSASPVIVREFRPNTWQRTKPSGIWPLGYYAVNPTAGSVSGITFGDHYTG